jgi:hypothetical protein
MLKPTITYKLSIDNTPPIRIAIEGQYKSKKKKIKRKEEKKAKGESLN